MRVRRRGAAPFGVIVAVAACGTLGMHMIIPALPATADALGVSAGVIQLAITLYLVGLAAGQLFYGPISDRLGRRPVLLAGLALFTAAGAAATLAPNAATLIGLGWCRRSAAALGSCWGAPSCGIPRRPDGRRRNSRC